MRDRDYSTASDWLARFFEGTEHAVEIRALPNEHGAGRAAPLFGRDLELIEAHCTRWDQLDRGMFFGVCTRKTGAPTGARADLAEMPALWGDIDTYKLGIAQQDVIKALLSMPLPPSRIVGSGGGVHPYWMFKEPIDVRVGVISPDDEEELLSALKGLCGIIAGDRVVCELARVLRLPGTHNTKTGALRLVEVLEQNDKRYELSDLQDMLDTLRPVIERPSNVTAKSIAVEKDPFLAAAERFGFKAPIDVERRLAEMTWRAPDHTAIHPTRISVSSSLVAQGVDDEKIFDMLMAATRHAAGLAGEYWNWKREEKIIRDEIASAKKKYPPKPARRAAPVVQLIQGGRQEQPTGKSEAAEDDPVAEDVPRLSGFPLNDLGNAMRLITQYSTSLRYVVNIGWHSWDGRRYEFDPCMVTARRLAHETVRTMLNQAFDAPAHSKEQAATKKTLIKFAVSSGNASKITGMLSQAEPHLAIDADDLNPNPWLLNCRNGTVDLRTGELGPHSQADLITKLVPVDYDPQADCPIFKKFIFDIFAQDQEMIAFVQRALGYSLCGSTREQVIFIMHGGGANGKSVLLETISALLSDYASHCPSDTFTSHETGGSGIPNDVARLAGARFVSIVETEHDKKLAEGLVKQASGGDRLTARFMRQEFFEFTPQFKLWLATNHKPRIRGTDNAIWRRIRLLPFNVTFVDKDVAKEGQPVKDLDLKDKLLTELPGILKYLIDGCMAWQAEGGLRPPVAVSEATKEYRESQDLVAAFLEDRCHIAPALDCAIGELFEAYKEWAVKNGERSISGSEFGSSLTEKGFIARKGGHGRRMRKGLMLKMVYDEADGREGQQ